MKYQTSILGVLHKECGQGWLDLHGQRGTQYTQHTHWGLANTEKKRGKHFLQITKELPGYVNCEILKPKTRYVQFSSIALPFNQGIQILSFAYLHNFVFFFSLSQSFSVVPAIPLISPL